MRKEAQTDNSKAGSAEFFDAPVLHSVGMIDANKENVPPSTDNATPVATSQTTASTRGISVRDVLQTVNDVYGTKAQQVVICYALAITCT